MSIHKCSKYKDDPCSCILPLRSTVQIPYNPTIILPDREAEFAIGTNTAPLPVLTTTVPAVLSTVSVRITDPASFVRLEATILSSTTASSVTTAPLDATLFNFTIRRVTPAIVLQTVSNTDIDSTTTTFTALDQPGVGTFTYVLEGLLVSSTTGTNAEAINNVLFTAEEII